MATAFAIFCETDGSLTFYNRDTVPIAGEDYEGKVASEVYTGFDTAIYSDYRDISWYDNRANVTSVSFADIISPVDTAYWFYDFRNSSLTTMDLAKLDTSNVTNMRGMFLSCGALTSLDLSSFNTSNVTNMDSMFQNCSALTTIYVSDLWNTAAVTSSSEMFDNCTNLVGGNGTVFNYDYIDATYAIVDVEGTPGYLTYKRYIPLEYLFIQNRTLIGIADAIREKEGMTESIPGDELANRITALPEPDEITNSQIIEVVAQDQIKIGDTVYTVEGMSDLEGEPWAYVLTDNHTATFSPDGTTLVLGGEFSGGAKVYSVSGQTITYISNIYADAGTTALSSTVRTAVFSPDGTTLVLGGQFSGRAKVYSVSGTTITYVSDIYADNGTTTLDNYPTTAVFSPDGTTLVLGGWFNGYAKIYSVSGTTITYINDIYADAGTTVLDSVVYTAAFSPDSKTFVLGGQFSGKGKVYSVSGQTIIYVSDIYADTGITTLDSSVITAVFSPDGTTLVLGGFFSSYGKVYSVNGTTITYVNDIYADAGTTVLDSHVQTAAFSPDGTTFVLGGQFSGRAKAYSVSGQTITYVNDIYPEATPSISRLSAVAFSPDGTTLVLGGESLRGKVYSVSGTTITYVSEIYKDVKTTALSNYIETAAFSPDGTTLVLGGRFSGAKVYSVSGTTITYVSNIYADAGTAVLNFYVYTAAFSPDGKTLVLGGWFGGYAKVYSVSGTTITYVSDIYANAGTTTLGSRVYTAAFSPDGTTLVLGGEFSGRAKVYSVSGQTITYVSNIYANTGTTALSSTVYTAAFSPDGTTLVLGGEFSGRAKVYSVSGQTITYVNDIYANTGTTVLDSVVRTAVFSPDGTTLVLGGQFSGYGKVYSVNGQTITYVSDIYADAGTTALSSTVRTAVFSPDGTTLVCSAKVYSVSGTTITYVSNIYANAGTTALSNAVYTAAFSPDGTTLVLGGWFGGYGKVYPINGTEIMYFPTAYLVENGDFTELPYGCYLGFSKSSAAVGENATVRTIGKYIVK